MNCCNIHRNDATSSVGWIEIGDFVFRLAGQVFFSSQRMFWKIVKTLKPKNHKKQLNKHKPQAITDVGATWQAGLLSINILYYDTSPIRAHFVDSARYV